MSVAVLVLLFAVVAAAVGLMAWMLVRKEPFYGVLGLLVLCCPSPLLAAAYLTL